VKYLVSAYVWLAFLLTCPVVFLVGLLVFAASAPFDPDRRVLHAYICRATFSYLRLVPTWDIEIQGRERIPQGACVLIANHQSMADVLVMLGLFRQYKFVSKASLFRLPIVGWMMSLARYVHLERGHSHSTYQMMASCYAWLARGMPVLIFPEGTYSEDRRLLPFKRGAFVLAEQAKVPLVPILIEGTTGLVEGDGPWLSPRCRIRVWVQPPVLPEQLGEDAARAAARMRELFGERLGRPAG